MRLTTTHTFNYPDFLIVGAAKSGTTSIHRYLRQHPDLFLPEIKETWFYHLVDNPNRAVLRDFPHLPTTLLAFLALFEEVGPNQVCGEVTPSYLHYYERTIRNIKRLHPRWQDLKIIMILREPVAKAVSHYQYVRRKGYDPENLSLYGALQKEGERRQRLDLTPDLLYVENTRYLAAVRAYLADFTHTRIFLYDDLKQDPQRMMQDLTEFLGVSPFNYRMDRMYNRSAPVRRPVNKVAENLLLGLKKINPLIPKRIQKAARQRLTKPEKIDPRALRWLRDAFREEVRQLGPLIGRDLRHWLRQYD
jgi:hypothetical protein